MAFVLSSISGNLISAASAGFAPTNSADVSAIASAYQVVSATATQLYAGTAYVTSVNDAPLSASRAGNAANASLASSAWYDGTGRLISSLPDSAAVSAIASAYQVVSSTATAVTGETAYLTGVNETPISAARAGNAATATVAMKAYTDTSNRNLADLVDIETLDSWTSGKQDELTFSYDGDKISAINGSALAGQGGGGGSVASPSGTIIVTDGTAIEATNSAIGVSTVEHKFLNLAPLTSQINYWYSNVLMGGHSVSGASLMKLQALELTYNPTTVFTVSISGNPIGGGSEIVGTATASSYGSSMEFDFPLDPSWGFGTIWASANPGTINLDTADNTTIAFYSATTASSVKELAWKDDIPSAVDIGIYEDDYHNKYVSSINSMQVSAKWAGSAASADYAYTAVWDKSGRYLSDLADKSSIPSGVKSPNGTIIANGFNVEATNSAVTTTVVPGYATTVVGWTSQVRPDTPVVCTLPSANENSKLFFQLDYGANMDVSAVYNGITATATAEGGIADVMFDVPNATTVSLYFSYYRYMLGSASASAADYLAPGGVGELAWASALPTYSYDSEDKISAINGSAIAGGAGGVDSATVSAIASSYAESAVSSYQPLSGMSGYASAFSAGEGLEFVQSGSDQVLQVEAPVDIVAGPGIVIDNPDGNTLRVSIAADYEVTLFETTFANAVGGDVTLSENAANFDQLRITYILIGSSQSYAPLSTELVDVSTFSDGFSYFTLNQEYIENGGSNTAYFIIRTAAFGIEGNKLKFKNAVGTSDFGSKTALTSSTAKILKVVGIHRINGGN